MVIYNSDIIFTDTSGQVRAIDSDLTLRANEAGGGDIIVGSGEALRPETDCRGPQPIDLGRDSLRWNTLHACSGNFIERPTVKGSGLVLTDEVITWEHAMGFLIHNDISEVLLERDGLPLKLWGLTHPITRKLHNRFSIMAYHLDIDPTLSGWFLVVSKRPQQDSASDIASGLFFWNPLAALTQVTVGSMLGNQEDWIFTPTDLLSLRIENKEGSGVLIDTIVTRAMIGLVQQIEASGV